MPRNLLVITYEFPPSGGGGVQRIAKFSRYLPEHGWTPRVVAAEPVPGRSLDPSLVCDVEAIRVTRTPARHVATAIATAIAPVKRAVGRAPHGTSRQTVGDERKHAATGGVSLRSAALSSRIARWIAVPDDAAAWRRGVVRAAVDAAREEPVEAVLASGPPFSAIIAGARVAEVLGVPFVADMRDGWASNPVVKMPTRVHDAYSAALERRALEHASVVTCTTPAIAEEARGFGAREAVVIPNGFDPSDLPARVPNPSGPLTIAYMGKVYFGHSDPTPFLESLARLGSGGGPESEIVFEIIGSWPPAIEATIDRLGLVKRVGLHAYLPHREALEIVARADAGLVLIEDRPGAAGSAPAKMYEYLGMGLPTLLIGPAGGYPAHVLGHTHGGVQVAPGDAVALERTLRVMARDKAEGQTITHFDAEAVREYDRRSQASRLGRVLDAVVRDTPERKSAS